MELVQLERTPKTIAFEFKGITGNCPIDNVKDTYDLSITVWPDRPYTIEVRSLKEFLRNLLEVPIYCEDLAGAIVAGIAELKAFRKTEVIVRQTGGENATITVTDCAEFHGRLF